MVPAQFGGGIIAIMAMGLIAVAGALGVLLARRSG
jgi:hypothetical protein